MSPPLFRPKSWVLLRHISLRTDGVGSEDAAVSGHVFYCRQAVFVVGRYAADPHTAIWG